MEAGEADISEGNNLQMARRPLVSVIISVYNDKTHVLKAVQSVLAQTLNGTEVIIVDDCSTDGTYEYLNEQLSHQPRVAIAQTESNTGGAGGPRNVGMKIAQAPYVTFLDSDDVLERHACYNLLHAAEKYGSDITVGRTRRFNVEQAKFSSWHSRLFRDEYFLESVEDNPEIVIDTNSVAKLYRTEFLTDLELSFEEHVHYEDLIFTARAFASARGIAVIPESVYCWNVYPQSVRKSITNQRDDIKNLKHRRYAIDRVMEVVDEDVNPRMRARLQVKVLRHDVRLYLNDIAAGKNRKITHELLTELQDMIRTVPEEAFDEISLPERLLMASTLVGNRGLITRTVNISRGLYDLYGDWSGDRHSGLWEPSVFGAFPENSLERRLTSFDPSTAIGIPWYNFQWNHRADSVLIDDANSVTIQGTTPDSFGKMENSDLQARVVIREKTGAKRVWAWAASYRYHADTRIIKWSADFTFPADLDYSRQPRMSVQLEFNDGATYSSQSIRVRRGFKGNELKTRPSSILTKLANIHYRPYCSRINTLAFRSTPVTERRKQLRNTIAPLTARQAQRIDSKWVPLPRAERFATGSKIMRKSTGPLDENLVVVESHMGKSQFDSPRAIADQLTKLRSGLKIVWVAEPGQNWSFGRNDVVIRHTPNYYRTLGLAKYIVDNQSLPDGYVKREGQIYVQTWHGIPLKKMGFDEGEMAFASDDELDNLKRKVDYWDFLTVPSEYFQQTFVPAYRFNGAMLPQGSPRNDILVNRGRGSRRWKRELGLDEHRRTVLYAPTFREKGATTLELDLEQFVERFGDAVQLLVRPHYLNRIRIPKHMRADVVDVSAVDDTNRILMATDALITDYSSIMFDYLVLDRPVVLYAYDFATYAQSYRGAYIDLRDNAPGPLVMSQDALFAELQKLLDGDDNHGEVRCAFKQKYAGTEPGDSARATVAAVWSSK